MPFSRWSLWKNTLNPRSLPRGTALMWSKTFAFPVLGST